jgi:N-acetyl-anhydromuramyl-L-alanine amidase AmpD
VANDPVTRVKWLQDTLRDYGFPLDVTGRLDERTRAAVDSVVERFKLPRPKDYQDADLFVSLYINLPVEPQQRVAAAR